MFISFIWLICVDESISKSNTITKHTHTQSHVPYMSIYWFIIDKWTIRSAKIVNFANNNNNNHDMAYIDHIEVLYYIIIILKERKKKKTTLWNYMVNGIVWLVLYGYKLCCFGLWQAQLMKENTCSSSYLSYSYNTL